MAYDQQSANAVQGTTSIEKIAIVKSKEDATIKIQETVPRSVPLSTLFVDSLHRDNISSADNSNADTFMGSRTIAVNNHSVVVVAMYFNTSSDSATIRPYFSVTNDADDATIYYCGYPVTISASSVLVTGGGKYISEVISFPVMGADKVRIRVDAVTGNVFAYAEVV